MMHSKLPIKFLSTNNDADKKKVSPTSNACLFVLHPRGDNISNSGNRNHVVVCTFVYSVSNRGNHVVVCTFVYSVSNR